MLDQLQRHLTDINGVDSGHDVRDYLITDRRLANALGQGALISTTDETVLLTQDEEGLALSVFLDEAMLARLRSAGPAHAASGRAVGWTSGPSSRASVISTILPGVPNAIGP